MRASLVLVLENLRVRSLNEDVSVETDISAGVCCCGPHPAKVCHDVLAVSARSCTCLGHGAMERRVHRRWERTAVLERPDGVPVLRPFFKCKVSDSLRPVQIGEGTARYGGWPHRVEQLPWSRRRSGTRRGEKGENGVEGMSTNRRAPCDTAARHVRLPCLFTLRSFFTVRAAPRAWLTK